jgi:NADH dehydrogenase FAD-containing subunit
VEIWALRVKVVSGFNDERFLSRTYSLTSNFKRNTYEHSFVLEVSVLRSLLMHIIIVGAGIAGMTTAIALHQRGHDVTVLEQTTALKEIGAGIQLAANGTHVLRELGLEEAVAKAA